MYALLGRKNICSGAYQIRFLAGICLFLLPTTRYPSSVLGIYWIRHIDSAHHTYTCVVLVQLYIAAVAEVAIEGFCRMGGSGTPYRIV